MNKIRHRSRSKISFDIYLMCTLQGGCLKRQTIKWTTTVQGVSKKGMRNGKNGCVTVKLIIHPYII